MKKPLLAVLAVAAVAVVAGVIVENTPERRMDRRIDRLLRTYEEPKQLFKRLVDDRDLLGLFVFSALWCGYGMKEHGSLWHESMDRLAEEICDSDCNWSNRTIGGPVSLGRFPRRERCKYRQAREKVWKRWGPYMERKGKEICEKAKSRVEFHLEPALYPEIDLRRTDYKEFRKAWLNR